MATDPYYGGCGEQSQTWHHRRAVDDLRRPKRDQSRTAALPVRSAPGHFMDCFVICGHAPANCIAFANIAIDLVGDPPSLRQRTGEC